MQRKTLISLLSIALLAAMVLAPAAEAQRGGGRRGQDGQGGRGQGGRGGGFGGGGFGGGGAAILGLLRVEAVREEVKITEDQQELVEILGDELREGRPDFPENFRDMSDEEREAFREKTQKWNAEQTAQAKDTLKAILEPAQYTRLTQISVQTQGVNALLDAEVAAALMLTEEQQKQLEATRQAGSEARGNLFGEVFRGGGGGGGFDRDAIREKMEDLQKESETKMLAHLTADQKVAFEALKGAHFEMPEDGRRGGFGGGRGGFGGGGRPGGGGGRPGGGGGDRPQRPE